MRKILSTLFLNLFIFTITGSDVIYDSAGNKLIAGIPYYILPLLRGTGGGFTVSRSTKDACPLNVTQEPFEVNHGVPFTFTSIVIDEEFIRASYPASIEVDITNPCSGSNILKVAESGSAKNDEDELVKSNKDKKKKDDDDDDKKVAPVKNVTLGGEFNTPESCFQIVEVDMMPGLRSYTIQHCPFKCASGSGTLTCSNIGVIPEVAGGKNYLGPTDVIFPVVFVNYIGTFSQSSKVSIINQSAKLTTFS